MINEDNEEVTIESALEDIVDLTRRVDKFLTYPENSQARKKILLEMARQFKEAVAIFEKVVEDH